MKAIILSLLLAFSCATKHPVLHGERSPSSVLDAEIASQLYARTFTFGGGTAFYIGEGQFITAEHTVLSRRTNIRMLTARPLSMLNSEGGELVLPKNEYEVLLRANGEREVSGSANGLNLEIRDVGDTAIIKVTNQEAIDILDQTIPPINIFQGNVEDLKRNETFIHITRREGQRRLSHFFSSLYEGEGERSGEKITTIANQGTIGVVEGDSGGPVFLVRDNKLSFVGVTHSRIEYGATEERAALHLSTFKWFDPQKTFLFSNPNSEDWSLATMKLGHNSIQAIPTDDLIKIIDTYRELGSRFSPETAHAELRASIARYFDYTLSDDDLDFVFFALRRTVTDTRDDWTPEDIANQIRMMLSYKLSGQPLPEDGSCSEYLKMMIKLYMN